MQDPQNPTLYARPDTALKDTRPMTRARPMTNSLIWLHLLRLSSPSKLSVLLNEVLEIIRLDKIRRDGWTDPYGSWIL